MRRAQLGRLLRGSAGMAVAMAVMNVATYAFTILAAHLLGPRDYGEIASLMGLLLIVNVVSLGLMATGARRIAHAPERRDEIESELMSATVRCALALGLLCLLLTPLIVWALDLGSWASGLLIGVSAVPLTLFGGQAGILQGERRWVALGALYLAMGLGRLVFGAILMPLMPNAFGAMLAVTLGAWAPAVVGALALGRLRRPVRTEAPRKGKGVLSELVGNSHALLIFFALSNLDVVLARARLDEYEAGLYAGALIMTKAVLFLPQFVVVIAFPSMASSSSAHRLYLRALAVVGTIGAVATLGAAVLSPLAVTFIGGGAYSEVESDIWLFAALGTVMALVQLMVYELVARQHRASVLVLWLGLAGVAVAGMLADDGSSLVRSVLIVDVALLVLLLLTASRHQPRQPAQSVEPATAEGR